MQEEKKIFFPRLEERKSSGYHGHYHKGRRYDEFAGAETGKSDETRSGWIGRRSRSNNIFRRLVAIMPPVGQPGV